MGEDAKDQSKKALLRRPRAAGPIRKIKAYFPTTRPYADYEDVALWLKARTQMAIGLLLFLALGFNAVSGLLPEGSVSSEWLKHLASEHPLELVSQGLAYGAGVELCYMLFTKAPDEALNPAILGLASLVVLLAAREPQGLADGLLILTLVAAMASLFFLSAKYLSPDKGTEE